MKSRGLLEMGEGLRRSFLAGILAFSRVVRIPTWLKAEGIVFPLLALLPRLFCLSFPQGFLRYLHVTDVFLLFIPSPPSRSVSLLRATDTTSVFVSLGGDAAVVHYGCLRNDE